MVVPCETNRLKLFRKTLKKYYKFGLPPYKFEIVVPTRTIKDHDGFFPPLRDKIKIVYYDWDWESDCCFNVCKSLNLGVEYSKYPNIIITCPEVRPQTNALNQICELNRGNYICHTIALAKNGTVDPVPKMTKTKRFGPARYYLGIFKREDILAINGWDEDFICLCSGEDDDFGIRFLRAGLKWKFLESIKAEHQWHPRWLAKLPRKEVQARRQKFMQKLRDGEKENLIKPKNGLIKLITML